MREISSIAILGVPSMPLETHQIKYNALAAGRRWRGGEAQAQSIW